MTPPLLEVRRLSVHFGDRSVVQDVSFEINRGEIVGLVGESGCGKTVTALSILRLLDRPGRIPCGSVLFEGTDLLKLREEDMRRIRGNRISMIFQEPMTALNPVLKIGTQVAEALMVHRGMSRREAWREAARLLEVVRIPDGASRVRDYPHQLSGGMRQRVMIAIALACRPALIIADEPTTALDVTIQAQILGLLSTLRADYGVSVLLITHSLAVIAQIAERVLVMCKGTIVEQAPVKELFRAPQQPYTRMLLDSIPRIRLNA